MRKLFLLLIAFCLILTSCDQILSPEEEPQNQHVHTWDEGEITKPATEAEDGEITYKCQREGCDATKTKSYHLHKWDSGEITKEATCWVDGEIRYTCTVCGYSYTEVVPKEDYHDIDETTHTCKICNEVFYFQINREANKNKVMLRATFMNKGLIELVMPSLIPNWNYTAWYAPEVVSSVSTSTLETLTIAEGVTTIAYQAFSNKTNLHTVVLPGTLTTIEQEAFMSSGITSLHIPASVTFIGAQGLAYCKSLTDIYYDGTSSQWATLLSSAKNILKGTDAIVHFTD